MAPLLRPVTIAVAVWVTIAGSMVARAGQHESIPSFRSGVSLVPVTVSIERADGTYADGIDVSRFRVLDDGAPRDIAVFDDGNVPIDLVLLLDTSASISARLPTMRNAAARILQSLRPTDRATLLSFGVRTTIIQPFTSDVDVLIKALASLSCDGSTTLYDALYVALHEFGATGTEMRRRAVVVVSDGNDTASLITFDDVLDEVRRRGVVTYTIRLMSPFERVDPFERSAVELQEMARDTGGRAFTTKGTEDVAVAYESIARDIAHQYVLGFIPAAGEKARFHRVTVLVNAPQVRVRARAGYLAAGDRQ